MIKIVTEYFDKLYTSNNEDDKLGKAKFHSEALGVNPMFYICYMADSLEEFFNGLTFKFENNEEFLLKEFYYYGQIYDTKFIDDVKNERLTSYDVLIKFANDTGDDLLIKYLKTMKKIFYKYPANTYHKLPTNLQEEFYERQHKSIKNVNRNYEIILANDRKMFVNKNILFMATTSRDFSAIEYRTFKTIYNQITNGRMNINNKNIIEIVKTSHEYGFKNIKSLCLYLLPKVIENTAIVSKIQKKYS